MTTAQIDHQQRFAEELIERARAEGVDLVGPGGLLAGLTKTVLEAALEAEMAAHLGYDKHDSMGRNGANSRNGTRTKTVLTEIGPVEIDVPRDRDSSFEPIIVAKRQRRLQGIDQIVLSLTARGVTTGDISAHFAEVYGAKISKDTISRITDTVLEELTEWQNRPLDKVYPVVLPPSTSCREVPPSMRSWSRSVMGRSPTGLCMPLSGSPSTVNETSSGCGPETAVRAQSSGCRC